MKKEKLNIIAFIPARAGSKRIPGKNIREMNGHPLIAYTIMVALKCGLFSKVITSTDCPQTAQIAKKYGADVPFLRPKEFASDTSLDIEWVTFHLEQLKNQNELPDAFAILRPTNPFRKIKMLERAYSLFCSSLSADSLRAIQKCSEHPYKMWIIESEKCMKPLFQHNPNEQLTPFHSMPYQSLPPTYVQNASLEIAYTKTVFEKKSISGTEVIPFITEDYEGYDINTNDDWLYANYLVDNKLVEIIDLN
ncbi:MAG: acylneuraminate cytidylyltransferase family protein [Oligoflexia bacterium]|nr:acylneuraminate cytidylyltransferase family protein [Oligoflexia bacterium]